MINFIHDRMLVQRRWKVPIASTSNDNMPQQPKYNIGKIKQTSDMATSTVRPEYVARVLLQFSWRYADCHSRQPVLITSVATSANNNTVFAATTCQPARANDGSLALRWLFLAVQLLQRLEFADQRLVLILQQGNTILQASHIVLLFPATLFRRFSECRHTMTTITTRKQTSSEIMSQY